MAHTANSNKRILEFVLKYYILFCDDGVNNPPDLVVTGIRVSMGEGATMAMDDVMLMDSQLAKLSYAFKMGQWDLRTFKENICISLTAKMRCIGLMFSGKMMQSILYHWVYLIAGKEASLVMMFSVGEDGIHQSKQHCNYE
jgi:cation transport ATPase